MENRDIVAAIHRLEVRVNRELSLNTTALELNNQRLKNLKESVDRHATILFGHESNDYPGLITRIAKIEQTDTERRWTLRTVLVACMGICAKFLYDFLSRL